MGRRLRGWPSLKVQTLAGEVPAAMCQLQSYDGSRAGLHKSVTFLGSAGLCMEGCGREKCGVFPFDLLASSSLHAFPVPFPSLPSAFEFPLARITSRASTDWLNLKRTCFWLLRHPSPLPLSLPFHLPLLELSSTCDPFSGPEYHTYMLHIYVYSAFYLLLNFLRMEIDSYQSSQDRFLPVFAILSVE